MRFNLALMFAAIYLVPCMARAQGPINRTFGLGLVLGEPAGITGKYWFDRKNALDVALGWGYYPYSGPALYVDYLYNMFTIVPAREMGSFKLLLYLGAGGKLGFWHHRDHQHVGVGLRIPFGVTVVFIKAPFDVFLEITPVIGFVAPDPIWFDLDGCIGARLYF